MTPSCTCQARTPQWRTPPLASHISMTVSSLHISDYTPHITHLGTCSALWPTSGSIWIPFWSTSALPRHVLFSPQEIYLHLESMVPVMWLDARRPRPLRGQGPRPVPPDLSWANPCRPSICRGKTHTESIGGSISTLYMPIICLCGGWRPQKQQYGRARILSGRTALFIQESGPSS